jgi:hypothetical protein
VAAIRNEGRELYLFERIPRCSAAAAGGCREGVYAVELDRAEAQRIAGLIGWSARS